MRTSDFRSKPTAKVMNETLNKKFGEKLDIENYSDSQLSKAASLIESRIAVLKKGKFNETLASEEFHRLKLMQDIVKTAISERKLTGSEKKKKEEIVKAIKRDNPEKRTGKGLSSAHAIATSQAKKVAEGKKDQDGNGKNDFDDVQIARYKAGGMPAKKAVAKAKSDNFKEAAKPDFLDLDKDGNKKEPMKKAAKDKKVAEVSNRTKQDYVDAAQTRQVSDKKTGWNKKGEEKKGKKADAARTSYMKRDKGTTRAVMTMKESVMKSISRLLREGEESKAELIMAVKDMVDKFTGWSEDIAQMQAQTAMEMADAIRDEMGADQAEAFTAAVQPALDAAFQSVKSAREALNNSVASLTGVAPTPMGGEPGMDAGMDMDMGMEPGADLAGDMDMGDEPPGDDAEMDMDMDATPVDRAKRESIEHRLRLTKILMGK